LTAKLRHYIGLGTMEKKLRLLLRDFEFVTLESLLPPADKLDFTLDTRNTTTPLVSWMQAARFQSKSDEHPTGRPIL
jgi:hypothetical protein